MKKVFISIAIFSLVIALTGCFSDKSSKDSKSDGRTATESLTENSDFLSQTDKNSELTEERIRALMKENINCMRNIFALGSLPTYGPALRDNIYQVEMTTYKNYAEFEDYIKSVYTDDASNLLLNNYPYEGHPKYINADGKLCINMDYCGGKGYYVDWTDYAVQINICNSETCEFTLTASIEEPADNPQKEQYSVNATAKKENGKWLLTKMIY